MSFTNDTPQEFTFFTQLNLPLQRRRQWTGSGIATQILVRMVEHVKREGQDVSADWDISDSSAKVSTLYIDLFFILNPITYRGSTLQFALFFVLNPIPYGGGYCHRHVAGDHPHHICNDFQQNILQDSG